VPALARDQVIIQRPVLVTEVTQPWKTAEVKA
jgi:hypothetical protein